MHRPGIGWNRKWLGKHIQIQRKEREAVRVGGFVEGKLVDPK